MSALVYLLSGHCFLTRTLVHDCFVAFHLLLGFLIAFAPHYLGYSMLDCFSTDFLLIGATHFQMSTLVIHVFLTTSTCIRPMNETLNHSMNSGSKT